MGCAVSKQSEEDVGLLNLSRERKKLMKSATMRRYMLAGAHCKYYQSLYEVALAIRLFVARQSSVPSPLLITFVQSNEPKVDDTLVPKPMYYQHTPSAPITHGVDSCKNQESPVSCESQTPERENIESEMEKDDERVICEHFYDPPVQMQNNDQIGWDFFNLFDRVIMEQDLVKGSGQTSDDDHVLKAVREVEGIPKLEEVGKKNVEEVKVVGDANVSQGVEDKKGLKVVDTPKDGRELLDALKDVEDHFIRAYDSGGEVSKMLETNGVHLQPALEEMKESSNKLIKSVPWSKSTLSRSSSSRSFLSSSSRSSLTWTESYTYLFDEYGAAGMEAGSHSLTLGRLYAWEKKLYKEVKAGDELRKIYECKYSQLSKKDAKGEGFWSEDKTAAEVRDVYSRISVTITSVDSISKRVQKLRDEELQPQLIELLHGLMRTWKIMLEVHQTQKKTMSEVKSFTCPNSGNFCNDSHRLATLQLEAALQNWRTCFSGYISAQKAYIEALTGWLSKFISPETESDIFSGPHYQINSPKLQAICNDWLLSMEKLPSKVVAYAMKNFGKEIRALWFQQGVEQQQKRKLDGLEKELDKRVIAFQKAEKKILEMKLCGQKVEVNNHQRVEYVAQKKKLLDMFKNRLQAEKAKHHDRTLEMQKVTLNGFRTGFSSVFNSLEEFSKDSLKMYNDLVAHGKLLS